MNNNSDVVFDHCFLEDNKMSICFHLLRMQSANLGSGILLVLCIPASTYIYQVKPSVCFPVCTPTSCQSIAHGYSSNQKGFAIVGHVIQSGVYLPSLGCHLHKLAFTNPDMVESGETYFPQLADVADVV